MRSMLLTLPLALAACNTGPASTGQVGQAGSTSQTASAKDNDMDSSTPSGTAGTAGPAGSDAASSSAPPRDIKPSTEDFGRIVEPAHEPDSDRVNPGGTASADDLSAPDLVPEAEKGEKGARNVLLTWGRALENKDFARAYAQYGDHGAKSGMSEKAFAERFSKYSTITVAMPSGTMEGAAGSSYYTAPTTIIGKLKSGGGYALQGPVVLRRVNDVPGATAEQLRWHIESADLKPRPI